MAIERADLDRVDLADVMTGQRIPPTTPGDVLQHEFMEPLGLSSYAVARAIGVPPNRISAIVKGQRAISAETALKLAQLFHTSAEMWMNLQTAHDLAEARLEMQAG